MCDLSERNHKKIKRKSKSKRLNYTLINLCGKNVISKERKATKKNECGLNSRLVELDEKFSNPQNWSTIQ